MGNNYDIVVGIPSLNEADSIGFVTKTVDEGLTTYFPQYTCAIVNIDNCSKDGTSNTFLNTKTFNPKVSLSSKGAGKGRNLLRLFEYVIETDTRYICTVDADLESINPEWMQKLLFPIVSGEVDFVVPVYTRNRYEGNTTNHFCYPILASYLNAPIRQPYAGDFGFNQDLARYWLSKTLIPPVYHYGIDIFMSMHTITGNFKVKEVYLGKKIHKPSYGKIVSMFQQAAATTFMILADELRNPQKMGTVFYPEKQIFRTSIDKFLQKPNRSQIEANEELSIKLLEEFINTSYNPLRNLHIDLYENYKRQLKVLAEDWVDYLTKTILVIKKERREINFVKLGELFSPFYLLRVISYFNEIDGLELYEIEKIFETQVALLKNQVHIL